MASNATSPQERVSHENGKPSTRTTESDEGLKQRVSPVEMKETYHPDMEIGRTPDNRSVFGDLDKPKENSSALFFVSVGTFKKPLDIFRAFAESAKKKADLSYMKTAVAGIMAGFYIAAGGLFSLSVAGGMPGIQETDPGLVKLAFASVFPVGLLLVKVTGAELWTGNSSTMATGLLNGTVTIKGVFYNWSMAWIFNFIGSLFYAYFFVYLAGILDKDPYRSFTVHLAEKKAHVLWHQGFLRGIGANWLVCLATTLGTSAQSVTGKMLGIWFPITAFVAIGYEHSVANMFLVPIGLMYGADGGFTAESFFHFIGQNLIPVTIGNAIGGAVFVSMLYHLYLGPVPFGLPHIGHSPAHGHGGFIAKGKDHASHHHHHHHHPPNDEHKEGKEGTVSVQIEHVMRHNDNSSKADLQDLVNSSMRKGKQH
mmetsp:Transcript_15047/g.21109  ORF Transcript_15047/g.21109 Transcript_15047/m.21109 type:complete len:425 (-) Transcript_15047:304-1578(-)|eukprot:CAMPEP_0184478724 /NCGR_PEP_ID=MMETSP0113_2-20130426/670_1 /TAXON_ID=91329 /ORGANISM="Norrisiella sphaerica, Strain BC52" /LENGTH=424 /DNA_ID=CAMNT_0026856611 /DNA_START=127 /DNA_END=1401 /DNA_ORIENTATION=+